MREEVLSSSLTETSLTAPSSLFQIPELELDTQ